MPNQWLHHETGIGPATCTFRSGQPWGDWEGRMYRCEGLGKGKEVERKVGEGRRGGLEEGVWDGKMER